MPSRPIYVGEQLFLGRVEEQKQWRAALNEVLNPPPDEDLPYIFLLYGDGGMGKTLLAKRFRDIAQTEPPFESAFQSLWIDWEDEKSRSNRGGANAGLQVGREYISPETVFDVIHTKAINAGWGGDFGAYQSALKTRAEAEKKAAAVLDASGERDELAALRGASTSAIAKILRVGLTLQGAPIGETGEKLAKALLDVGVKVSAEQAAHLRAALERRLRLKLDPKQFEIFLNPNEQLARALADGLKKIAGRKPLILFLDTYETVDRADIWLRETMRAAGPNAVWVIGGRNNLARGYPFEKYGVKGYADEFPRRLITRDMLQLAEQDIRAIFADRAPKRPLDDSAIAAFSRATRGVPLAIDEAAEMWSKDIALADIVGDIDEATPRDQIVQKMTARYYLHVPDADKPALWALALARGDVEILRAMLRPADATSFDLDALLHRLERDYASVHYERYRLHDDPAYFIQHDLKDELHRTDDRVRMFLQRAIDTLNARLKKLGSDLPRLEDRCADDDWVKAALDLTDYLFWHDESAAWHWLVPRLVESMAYSRELMRGLVQTAHVWEQWLSTSGKKRANILQVADDAEHSSDELAELLDELTRLERLGYLKNSGENERRAILDLWRGHLLYNREKYTEALAQYERVERELPEQGEALKKQLGETLYELAGKLMWQQDAGDAVYSAEAERILPKVVAWLPDNQGAWYRLGVVLYKAGKFDDALAAYQRASDLDPKDAYPHYGRGNVYYQLNKFDDALAAYQRAIELDPKYAAPHYGRGNVYRALGKFDDALAAYQRAIDLDPKYAAPHNGRGNVYQLLGQYEKALSARQKAVELAPEDGAYRSSLVGILRKLGREAEAQEHIKIARGLIAKENEYNRACFESICGNADEALTLLKIALEKKQTSLEWARRDPDFEFIRNDPRFKALVGE